MLLKSFFIIIFSLFTVLPAQAANYGKFKLVPNSSIIESAPVVFLLNSDGDIKVLENRHYYSINNSFFFGELKLEFISGGDEDALHAIYNLSDNKITSGCAAFIDYKNGYAEKLTINGFKLLKWNKSSNQYESMITSDTNLDSEACYEDLFRDQKDGMKIF